MGRSRHGHRAAPIEGGGLPSWAQRHLGEAAEADEALTVATPSPIRHRRRAAREPAHRLKGWGVAVVSVAAAVGAVPLAISSVAADRSDDPLPTVNTFTAGAPGPLESGGAEQGGVAEGGTRTVTVPAPPGDPSTGGILEGPTDTPGGPGAGPAVAVPQPAALVKPTVPAAPSTTPAPARPLAGTSTTAPKPTPTTTGGSGGSNDDDEPRTTPKPSAPADPPASSSGSSQPSGDSGGLLPAVGKAAGGVVGGAGRALGGVL